MNKNTLSIAIIIALTASLALADACDGVAVFRIWNDTLVHSPGTYPEPGPDIIYGCPSDLYFGTPGDTTNQIYFPDTLLWPSVIYTYLHDWFFWGGGAYIWPDTITGESYYNSSHVSASVEIPPHYCPNCCKSGIYVKARMFDAASGDYSPWVDINTTDMFYLSYVPPHGYFMQISLCNFKARNLSSLMGFDCDSDSLILYVWDCNDGDLAGSAGEFAVWRGTFADGDDISCNDIYLNKFVDTDYPSIFEMDLFRGWNLISNPTTTDISSSMFDSDPFGYDATIPDYYSADYIVPGKGYFALSMEADTLGFIANLSTYTDTLHRDWNLIGATGHDLWAHSLTTEPCGLIIYPIFGWNGMEYYIADILNPGKGYWVLSSGEGRITVGP